MKNPSGSTWEVEVKEAQAEINSWPENVKSLTKLDEGFRGQRIAPSSSFSELSACSNEKTGETHK